MCVELVQIYQGILRVLPIRWILFAQDLPVAVPPYFCCAHYLG